MKKNICLTFILIISCFVFSIFAKISESAVKEKVQEVEEHDVSVTLKLVQVYVTDKKGNPVTDLEKDDFEIYDKGKLKTITDFEKHVLTVPVVETAKAETVREKAAPVETPKLNRKFYIFFDFAFNTSRGILDSKKAALHFIDEYIQPTDELGLFSFSAGEGLILHEILTKEHNKIREVVESFGIKKILGRAENLERKYWRQVMELDELSKQGADPFEMAIKQQEKEVLKTARIEFQFQISAFIQTMRNLAKALRYVQGHKHIIMFSSGIPRVVFEGAIVNTTSSSRQNDRFEEGMFGRGKLRREYENMNKELASSSCAIHTVYSAGSVASLNVEIETDYAIKDGGYMDRQLSGIVPLQWISEASGGKHFGNIKNYDSVMKEIQSFTGSYYILGYYIDEKRDGKYRKLKVKLKRKDCKVFAQEGYYNPKPFSKYSKLEKQYQFLELALIENPRFQAPLTLPSDALSCEVDGFPSFLMLSKIPVEYFDEISGKRVEIVNLVFNEENDVVSVKRVEVDLSKPPKDDVYNYSVFYLPPGKYRSRIVLRNLDTGRAAVASSSAVIPDDMEEGIRLYPPLLIVPKTDTHYINTRGIRKKAGEKEFSALSNIYPFDALKFSPLMGELERGTPELFVLSPGVVFGTQNGIVKFYTRLVYEPTWEEIPIKVTAKKTGDVFTFMLPTAKLLPGRYYLYLFAEDQDTQARANVNTTFVVKQ
jgi:VWFA-related protein